MPDELSADTGKLLALIDAEHIVVDDHRGEGWQHIGALLTDAVLQRRQRYDRVVVPRAQAIRDAWPEAATTSGLRARLVDGNLGEVIRWTRPRRLVQFEEMLTVFESHAIETVHNLATVLADEGGRAHLRLDLRSVRDVGPKTLDYLDILVGLPDGVAIDVRVRKVASRAGVTNLTYDHLAAVVRGAAASRGWTPRSLDAALWSAGK